MEYGQHSDVSRLCTIVNGVRKPGDESLPNIAMNFGVPFRLRSNVGEHLLDSGGKRPPATAPT
jgi:hypothetical protein